VADAIQTRLSDPRIPPITSVTRVEVTADLALARVYVSVMESDARRALCLAALKRSAGHLRWLLGRQLRTRKVPALEFHLDDSVRGSFETVQLIDRVMAELDGPPADADGDRASPAEPASDDAGAVSSRGGEDGDEARRASGPGAGRMHQP
jgi:ribosome-binding factor A